MYINKAGIRENSFARVLTPSAFARKALYYCTKYGHYFCDSHYHTVRRPNSDFLLLYLREGSLKIKTHDSVCDVSQDDIVLIDGRYPHAFHCSSTAEFLWFCFNGNSSESYYHLLVSQHGSVFHGSEKQYQNVTDVLRIAMANTVDEHQLSLAITRILCHLANMQNDLGTLVNGLRPATEYIREHFNESIALSQLAGECHLSVPHFSRMFKRHLNCTPHQYLLAYRIEQSKYLLVNFSYSVEMVAYKCGFNSTSHYVRAFRGSVGMTPATFRRLRF